MGIFGWDLPPGCSINDIPGNRPEDAEWENLWDELWDEKKNPAHFTPEELVASESLFNNDDKTHINGICEKVLQFGIDTGEKQAYEASRENEYYQNREVIEVLQIARKALTNSKGRYEGLTHTNKAQFAVEHIDKILKVLEGK